MAPLKMRFGLLWYDADKKRPAREKIDEAAERYVEKFGDRPDTCYVHPGTPAEHPEFRVLASPLVLPNHFLLGVEAERRTAVGEPFVPLPGPVKTTIRTSVDKPAAGKTPPRSSTKPPSADKVAASHPGVSRVATAKPRGQPASVAVASTAVEIALPTNRSRARR